MRNRHVFSLAFRINAMYLQVQPSTTRSLLKWRSLLLFILARFPSCAENSSIDPLDLEYLFKLFPYFGNFQVKPLSKNTNQGRIFKKRLLYVLNVENTLLLISCTGQYQLINSPFLPVAGNSRGKRLCSWKRYEIDSHRDLVHF